MSERLWARLTRVDTLVSLVSAVGGGAALTAFATFLAGKWDLVAAQGWAAVVLVGSVAASIAVIALSLVGLCVLWWTGRRQASPGMAEFSDRLAAVEGRTGAEPAGDVEGAIAPDVESAVRGVVNRPFERLGQDLGALGKRLEATESRLAQLADAQERAVGEASGAGVALAHLIGEIRDRQDGLAVQIGAFEDHLRRLLRVRDAARRLEELDGRASRLSVRLLRADRQDYPDLNLWLAEFGEWRSCVAEFWHVVARWDEAAENPLGLSTSDLDDVTVMPDDERFAAFVPNQRYRALVVSSRRHLATKGEAMARIRAEAQGEARGHPNPA